jgi:hypothetical protein
MARALSCSLPSCLIVALTTAASAEQAAATCESGDVLVLPFADDLADPDGISAQFSRDLSIFGIRGLVDWRDPAAVTVERGQLTIRCAAIDPDLASRLDSARDFDGTLDPARVRSHFETAFPRTIAARGQEPWIRSTRDEMGAATGYESWQRTIVPFSAIKRKTRVIYRSPVGFEPAISVSETHDSTSGDASAARLETEVAVARRDGSGDWDFYAYDLAGRLSDHSFFPAGERPSPQVCITCHYDGGARTVSRFLPR